MDFYRGDYDLVFATGLSSQPQNYWFDLIVNYAFPFLYSVLCWLYFAGTPGKRLMRLKVLDEKQATSSQSCKVLFDILAIFHQF